MAWDFVVIAYIGAFLGVLLLIEGLAQLLGLRVSAGEQAINRRLRMLAKGVDSEEVLRLLRRDQRRDRGPVRLLGGDQWGPGGRRSRWRR